MNVVVIGLGSMGQRRIRLIKQYSKEIQIFGIDLNEERRSNCKKLWDIQTAENLSELCQNEKIECAFISTSPLSHASIIKECLEQNMHVFTELNLVSDGYLENIKLAKNKSLTLFLSSTFLYRKEIEAIKESVLSTPDKLNYTYHVGQYLPDWHPWEKYQDFFIGHQRTNGCRELFAIELPWIIDIFGEIETIEVNKDKNTTLSINYNDNYQVMIKHVSGHKGVLSVDVISRKAVRNLEVYGEHLYLEWDGSPEGLYAFNCDKKEMQAITLYEKIDQLENYSHFVVENAYFNEIDVFFNTLKGQDTARYTFEKDQKTLEIIDWIEC
ncbi:MAG: Gfo/Idh/MocA family oxidoreductase [Eubacterium sp.]